MNTISNDRFNRGVAQAKKAQETASCYDYKVLFRNWLCDWHHESTQTQNNIEGEAKILQLARMWS